MKETVMNQERLAKLQAQVRIGGKVITAGITYFHCSFYNFFLCVILFHKQLSCFCSRLLKKKNSLNNVGKTQGTTTLFFQG